MKIEYTNRPTYWGTLPQQSPKPQIVAGVRGPLWISVPGESATEQVWRKMTVIDCGAV